MVNDRRLMSELHSGSEFGFSLRLSVFYGVVFLLIGGFLPYFAVWLDGRGLTSGEIGLILATPLMVRVMITPVISFAADRTGDRRSMLVLLAWGTLAASLVFTTTHGFWTIMAASIVFAIFWTSIMPLAEAVAMAGVRRAGLDYGRMRLWGSITFIAASTGGGFAIERWGSEAALWTFILASSAIVVGAHLLPRPSANRVARSDRSASPVRVRDAVALVRTPLFLLFLLSTSAAQSAHAIYYVFGTLHWREQGISTGIIGLLWAVGVVAEVLLFTRSSQIVRAIGPLKLIAIAGLAAAVRWSLTAMDPAVGYLFVIQILHGATFGAAHLGAVHFISDAVPESYAGTAQGLYASVTSGIAMGSMMAVSGLLYHSLGGGSFYVMAVLGAVALLAALLLMGRWHGGRIVSDAGGASRL